MDKIDLSLMSMDDLVFEIRKRHDTVCLITRKQISEDKDFIDHSFKDKVGVIGLMSIAKQYLQSDYINSETGTFS